jgi:RNA polymerase sigma-70 factor (ECF subfamily)
MFTQYKDEHLSRIETMWTVLMKAHHGSDTSINNAQAALLQRYCGAVYRYLVAVVGNVHEADELCQELALRVLQGTFKGANPDKGRFRDYVKTALFNLIRRHHRKKNQGPGQLAEDAPEPAAPADPHEEQNFADKWREELLTKSWEALAQHEEKTGQPFHTFLQYRTQNPKTSSSAMAEEFSRRQGKPLTSAGVRQTLHRARERFGELLIEEVARSLQTQDKAAVEGELAELGLLAYCQDAVQKWKA